MFFFFFKYAFSMPWFRALSGFVFFFCKPKVRQNVFRVSAMLLKPGSALFRFFFFFCKPRYCTVKTLSVFRVSVCYVAQTRFDFSRRVAMFRCPSSSFGSAIVFHAIPFLCAPSRQLCVFCDFLPRTLFSCTWVVHASHPRCIPAPSCFGLPQRYPDETPPPPPLFSVTSLPSASLSRVARFTRRCCSAVRLRRRGACADSRGARGTVSARHMMQPNEFLDPESKKCLLFCFGHPGPVQHGPV